MRRLLIRHLLPLLFAAVPVLAAVVVYLAVPPAARADYANRLPESPIDWVILGVGGLLFVAQTAFGWLALRAADGRAEARHDKWLTHLGQAAEWFPLLGLIGTVAAILQTFGRITPGVQPTPQEIIQSYAPAITATGSGLYMAFVNILPGWVVVAGRELIRSLAGDANPFVPLTPSDPGDR
jgi:hypothetical protein